MTEQGHRGGSRLRSCNGWVNSEASSSGESLDSPPPYAEHAGSPVSVEVLEERKGRGTLNSCFSQPTPTNYPTRTLRCSFLT